MRNHTLFISDLHLHVSLPEVTERFERFWRDYAPAADAIYILGDFFETWIGDDDNSPFHNQIKQRLKEQTQQGKTIYMMRGNRDFILGTRFAQETGCILLEDPSNIKLYGCSILLTHGDMLCLNDKAHQRFRKWAYHPLTKAIFLKLPLSWRQAIANKIRHTSKNYTRQTDLEIMDVVPEEVIRWMELYQVNYLIHGHTHKPAFHNIHLKNEQGLRMVLGDWHQRGHALRFFSDKHYEFIDF